MRQLVMKQALALLIAEDIQDNFSLDSYLKKAHQITFLGAELMPTQEIALSDKEKEIVQEVQKALGLPTIEETIEYLARERIQELLGKLAGQELRKPIGIYFKAVY